MISFTPDHLDAMNRDQERKIRTALGSGVVRLSLWDRLVSWWNEPISTTRKLARDAAISLAAGLVVGIVLAWVLTP